MEERRESFQKQRAPPSPIFVSFVTVCVLHRSLFQCLDFDGQNRWKVPHNRFPGIARIGRCVNLSTCRSEINPAGVERIDRHGIAQDVDVAIFLRKAFRQFFPFVAAGAAAINAQFTVRRVMLGIALDRNDIDRFRIVRVHIDRKPEITW